MRVPKLRFKEFKGKWEVKKLEELLLFKNGINATKEQYGKGVKFINVMDIINNDFIFHDNIIGCVDITEKVFEDSKVEYGDVLFQRSSETREEVGQASVYLDKDKSATFGGFVIRGKKIGEYNPVFMNFLLKTDLVRKDITDKSGGSTRYNVGQETLKTIAIHLPSIPEQTKIANFLIAINEKIAQLTQKCELLARYKKGVMQQIFSQELRFKDDGDRDFPDWEDILLGEIINFENGKAHESSITDNGHYIVVNSKFISSNGTVIKRSNNAISPLKKDSIVMVMSDVPNGKALAKCYFIEYDNKYTLNQRICSITSDKALSKFLFYQINRNPHYLSFDNGVGQTNLRKDDVLNCPIIYPLSLDEQTKISNFLTSIDEKITEAQTYLDTVKQYKQGLLQQMFV